MAPHVLINLDFLRAVAVLLVLFDHLGAEAFGMRAGGFIDPHHLGRVGVLLFFVHTSFVLMQSLERTSVSEGAVSFYIRRAFRIYPLSWLCILTALVLRCPAMPSHLYFWIGWKHVIANIALATNITNGPRVIVPLWSLPWEVQMYLALPFVYWLVSHRRGGLIWGMLLCCAAATALSFSLDFTPLRILQYAPCFLSGVMAYAISKHRKHAWPAYLWPVALLAAISGHRLLWVWQTNLKNLYAGYLLCITVAILLPGFREINNRYVAIVSHMIARYSFGVYLFQVPVIWLCFFKLAHWHRAAQWTAFAIGMVAVPWCAYHGLEKPMMRAGGLVAGWYNRRTGSLHSTCPVASEAHL